MSDPVCEKAGDGLVATKNMILAGKGDDGICRIENVDQENQGKVVRKALDQTLQETDLRTIRKEIAKVAQRVAQSGFPFAQYGNVQNLSKRLVQAARTIRSKAAQDCGGDQSMRNLAMKVCRNVAINGKAMPCVLNKASQLNVAAQAGECLQQVMVKTKAMQEAVSMVEASSTLTLDNPTTVSTAQGHQPRHPRRAPDGRRHQQRCCVARRPHKGILSVGAGLAAIGAGYLGLSIVLANQKVRPSKAYRTYAGIKPPVDGRMTELSGTIADVKDACDQDVGCRGWVFESKSKPEVCRAASCAPNRASTAATCDPAAPSGCVSMVDRVRPATQRLVVRARGRPKGRAPSLACGLGNNASTPRADGGPRLPQPPRNACGAWRAPTKGERTLYHTMPSTLKRSTTFRLLNSPMPSPRSHSQGPSRPRQPCRQEEDAPRLRIVGIAGLSAGAAILCLVVGAWLARDNAMTQSSAVRPCGTVCTARASYEEQGQRPS